LFGKAGVRVATLSDAELKKAERMCSPEFNPKPWEEWRERLNKMSGGPTSTGDLRHRARDPGHDGRGGREAAPLVAGLISCARPGARGRHRCRPRAVGTGSSKNSTRTRR
jgi:hypothetical protein